MNQQPTHIILFDGVCNLCNGVVQFVIKRDKKGLFHFAALQSEGGAQILQKHNLPQQKFDSFVLLEEGKIYTKSTAALKIAKHLGGGLSVLYALIIVPKALRDIVYSFVARNRYRFFGKKNECMLPTPALKQKFL